MPFKAIRIVVAVFSAALCSCGGGSGPTPNAPSPSPGNTTTVTITPAGVDPKEVAIPLGGRLTMVNRDTRAHDMNSDPHPEHTDCPDINLGLIPPGQSREGRNLVIPQTCGYHDHNDPLNAAWLGRVVVR